MNTTEKKLILDFINSDADVLTENIDWNLLIQVVEKIEDLGYGVCISTLTVRISHADIQTTEETKIKSVYKAVIEFIQWYNQQKQ